MRAVHQILASVEPGDAISDMAILVQRSLRDLRYESEIFAQNFHPSLTGAILPLYEHRAVAGRQDGVIFHHSIGSEAADYVARTGGRKLMIYHNITPAEFVADHSPDLAALLTDGRETLRRMSGSFQAVVGVSRFNAKELSSAGFSRVAVLPISIDMSKFNGQADDGELADRLSDGRTTFVFVGRLMPHKRPDALLDVFRYYVERIDPEARLFLIGGFDPRLDRFNRTLVSSARSIPGEVHITGKESFARLVTVLRRANLFCSMSEHEGFMVPLVEAMHLKIPILANDIPAVRETLGGAGVIFSGASPAEVAEMAYEIVSNERLRTALFQRQNIRASHFAPNMMPERIGQLIDWWMDPSRPPPDHDTPPAATDG
jgi:glycosyltransferase involved in cell wall biosynthesis